MWTFDLAGIIKKQLKGRVAVVTHTFLINKQQGREDKYYTITPLNPGETDIYQIVRKDLSFSEAIDKLTDSKYR